MHSITIFYSVLGSTKMMLWKGSLDAARKWFESSQPATAKFVGSVYTEALKDAMQG